MKPSLNHNALHGLQNIIKRTSQTKGGRWPFQDSSVLSSLMVEVIYSQQWLSEAQSRMYKLGLKVKNVLPLELQVVDEYIKTFTTTGTKTPCKIRAFNIFLDFEFNNWHYYCHADICFTNL